MKEYLKQENDFFNVTLACDGNQQMKAHNVILAAGSVFFRDILANAKHPEPFIFLSGVKKGELKKIVEFLYSGETSIDQNDLEKFLEISQLLQIKGVGNVDFVNSKDSLTSVDEDIVTNKVDGEIQNQLLSTDLDGVTNHAPAKENKNDDESIDSLHSKDQNDEKTDLVQEVRDDQNTRTEDCVDDDDEDESEHTKDDTIKEEALVIGQSSSKDFYDEKIDLDIDVTGELLNITEKLIEKVDGLWECKKCCKTFVLKSRARSHTETHLKSITHTCRLCGNTLSTRHGLWQHVRLVHSDHSDSSFVCSACGKSGMNKMKFRNHKYQCAKKYKSQINVVQ